MICRHGHGYFEVSKRQGKFPAPGKLVILPALEVAVYAKTRIPLRHGEQMIAVFSKIFIATSSAHAHTIRDLIVPIELHDILLSWLEWGRKINTHHGLIHDGFQFLSC